MTDFWIVLIFTLMGTVLGSIISFFPSLHVYNVAGICLLIWTAIGDYLPLAAIAPFFLSMVVAFAFVNAIPMTLMGAPDESATVTILPGTRYLQTGRGYEAVMISGIGTLMGVAMLALLTPIAFSVFPYVHVLVSPHLHWVMGLVIVYMLMSEWPKGCGYGRGTWGRLSWAWANVFAGLITFLFSAILGIIIINRSIISPEIGFQNIMPVFIGLFALPSIYQNLLSRETIPAQHICDTVDLNGGDMGKSVFQGTVGGLMAAYIPAVTMGIGAIIAGHATALRGDKLFIVSGGVAKLIYYVGAFLFMFIITPITPSGLGRGGLRIILTPVFTPQPGDYYIILATIIISGCTAFLMLPALTRTAIKLLARVDYKVLYVLALLAVSVLVTGLTGFRGFFVMTVASAIGSIPVFYHSRRSNCMAVLLVPIALNMAGIGEEVAYYMGLL